MTHGYFCASAPVAPLGGEVLALNLNFYCKCEAFTVNLRELTARKFPPVQFIKLEIHMVFLDFINRTGGNGPLCKRQYKLGCAAAKSITSVKSEVAKMVPFIAGRLPFSRHLTQILKIILYYLSCT